MFQTKLSPWIVVDDYCAMRVVEGSDPENIANRVAFIEKTPRVRVAPFTNGRDDYLNWRSGPKGSGCSAGRAEVEQAYGFDPDSRAWCDAELQKMGFQLT